ncbi:hypothetical protein P3W24_13945 [Luteibacter sp. PPL201]|jgi:hypothetical protein|uniref:Uncharacterized protein n=1 Tax=Luteibacter sahnii TaxID=3021977 RepID=A0ABT6BDG2_9GAMM|nr:hypothetical protein [Luteibacter sp. PPL193]MDY1550184.1 hypothetical protein [Luteibacter sp. PPL193]
MSFWTFGTRRTRPRGRPLNWAFADTTDSERGVSRLAPSGTHYALSREAFDLLLALRSGDHHEAMFRAYRLHQMARDNDFPDTQEMVEALEIALVCCESCEAAPVHKACAQVVRTMVLDGLIHEIPAHAVDDAPLGDMASPSLPHRPA